MRRPILALAATAAALSIAVAGPSTQRESADQRAIRATVTDYVLGFYEAAPDRLTRALAPDMTKRGFWAQDGRYGDASDMSFDQAIALARSWNNEGQQGELSFDPATQITLFEVADKTAAAKVTAFWGQDYFHLAKQDGKWIIHHVMWQSAPIVAGEASAPARGDG